MFNRMLKKIGYLDWKQRPAIDFAGNRPICVKPTVSIKEADDKLKAAQKGVPAPIARGLNDLLVTVDGTTKTRLIGIVNELDINKSTANNSAKIIEIMTPFDETSQRYPYLTKQESILKAINVFTKPIFQPFHNTNYLITALPILSRDDYSVAGLLTPSDIMVAMNSGDIPIPKGTIKSHVTNLNEAALPNYTLTDISVLMRNFGYLTVPIVENTDSLKLLGIITQQTVIEKHQSDQEERDEMQVSEIMTPFDECFTIQLHEPIADAVNIFSREHGVGMLLIINDSISRKLEGYIGRIQILQILLNNML